MQTTGFKRIADHRILPMGDDMVTNRLPDLEPALVLCKCGSIRAEHIAERCLYTPFRLVPATMTYYWAGSVIKGQRPILVRSLGIELNFSYVVATKELLRSDAVYI